VPGLGETMDSITQYHTCIEQFPSWLSAGADELLTARFLVRVQVGERRRGEWRPV